LVGGEAKWFEFMRYYLLSKREGSSTTPYFLHCFKTFLGEHFGNKAEEMFNSVDW
jgi:hypothetical protein